MLRISPLLLLGAVLSIVSLAGCQQHRFMLESDYKHYQGQALGCPSPVPDCKGDVNLDFQRIEKLRDVMSPEAPKREISLAECFALALENGRTGANFDRQLGQRFTLIGSQRLTSPGNLTDSIRVFSYDPAIQAMDIEQSLAKFDAFFQSSMTWNKVDRPVGTALDTFFASGRSAIEQDQAQFQASLQKPLPTGGVAGITFSTEYELSNLNPRVNPSYRPSIALNVEQPLLQNFGVGINELLTQHPGSVRGATFPVGGRVPGIILTRIFHDQTKVDFERRLQDMLFTVEEAYWELYSAYWELYSREIAVRAAHAAWMKSKALNEAGRIPLQDLKQVEQQYQTFRAQRLQASGSGAGRAGVLEAERRLRYVIGLPPEDGTRLVPRDPPTIAPFTPDINASYAEALQKRPELTATRMDVHAAQLSVLRDQNALLPDVRAFANYEVVSLGSHLDSNDPNGALHNLALGNNVNWTLGLLARMPLGYREAHAEAHRSQLLLWQRVAFLKDQEEKLLSSLVRVHRDLVENYRLIQIQRARREAATIELSLREQEFRKGGKTTIDVLLEAQRNWADSLRDEQIAIAQYNISLAEYQRQKGASLEANNVVVAEGPLPKCVQEGASRNIRERNGSIKLMPCNVSGEDDGTWRGYEPSVPKYAGAPLPEIVKQFDTHPLPENLSTTGTPGQMPPAAMPSTGTPPAATPPAATPPTTPAPPPANPPLTNPTFAPPLPPSVPVNYMRPPQP